MKEQENE